MFEDLNKPSGVEDIFSDTEVGSAPVTPASSGFRPAPTKPTFVPPPVPPGRGLDTPANKPSGSKGLVMGIGAVVVLLVLGAGYWYWWRPLAAQPAANQNQPATNIETLPENSTPTDNQPAPAPTQDTDGDRLNDQEEFTIGTDASNPDTDNDGLFDGEEVLIYSTNPLNGDTDGDTFTDGEEVRNNYDPNGPGRLLNLPNGELNFQELNSLLQLIDNETA